MEVNGAYHNPHYVAEKIEGLHSLIATKLDPVMMEVFTQIALHRPVRGTVQAFVLEVLEKGPKEQAPESKEKEGAPADLPAYFADSVDPVLEQLLRAVAVSEPEDVKEFLVSTCKEHPDLEAAVLGFGVDAVSGEGAAEGTSSGGASAAASGADTSDKTTTLRSGMTLNDIRVMITLVHSEEGAEFTIHEPRTSRQATCTVPAHDEVLSALLLQHGSMALYHTAAILDLSEDAKGKFVLRWNPPKKMYTPDSRPVGAAGLHLGGRFLAVALREDAEGITISGFDHRSRHSAHASVPFGNAALEALLAEHGPTKAMYHVGPLLKLTDTPDGKFDIHWLG